MEPQNEHEEVYSDNSSHSNKRVKILIILLIVLPLIVFIALFSVWLTGNVKNLGYIAICGLSIISTLVPITALFLIMKNIPKKAIDEESDEENNKDTE